MKVVGSFFGIWDNGGRVMGGQERGARTVRDWMKHKDI